MARTPQKTDGVMIETAFRNTEASGQVKDRKSLFIIGVAAYNESAKANPDLKQGISANTFKKRIEEMGLVITLPMGKRGRKTGSTGGGRKSNDRKRIEAFCGVCPKRNSKRVGRMCDATCNLHKDCTTWMPETPSVDVTTPAVDVVAPAVDATPAPETAPVVTVAEVPAAAELATA